MWKFDRIQYEVKLQLFPPFKAQKSKHTPLENITKKAQQNHENNTI